MLRVPTVEEVVRRVVETVVMGAVVYAVTKSMMGSAAQANQWMVYVMVAYMVYALFVDRAVRLPVVSKLMG